MPKIEKKKVGEIHQVRKVRTFGDKVVSFVETALGVVGFVFIIVIVSKFVS